MAEITLTAAFSTVPAPEQEAIKRLLTETIEQLAQEDKSFSRARVVFTESDERCGLTAELDGVKKEGVPLVHRHRAARGRPDRRGRPGAAQGSAPALLPAGDGEVTDAGVLLFVHGGCTFTVADGVQPPKAGSLLFCRHLPVRAGDRVLEIGTGIGLAAVLAARAGARVVATDVVDAAVRCARANAVVNGVADRVEVLAGRRLRAGARARLRPDLHEPAPDAHAARPRARRRGGGGRQRRPRRLGPARPGDRGRARAPARRAAGSCSRSSASSASRPRSPSSHDAGFEPAILGQETQAFPRIGYERHRAHPRARRGGHPAARAGGPPRSSATSSRAPGRAPGRRIHRDEARPQPHRQRRRLRPHRGREPRHPGLAPPRDRDEHHPAREPPGGPRADRRAARPRGWAWGCT